jgi:hypothetical protein
MYGPTRIFWTNLTPSSLKAAKGKAVEVAPKRRPPGYATLVTMLVSGVWHGVCPGYGLFFFCPRPPGAVKRP